jgi:hypothetical protein
MHPPFVEIAHTHTKAARHAVVGLVREALHIRRWAAIVCAGVLVICRAVLLGIVGEILWKAL